MTLDGRRRRLRRDTVAIKNELSKYVLSDEYWKKLSEFVTGKATREDWDAAAQNHLKHCSEAISLHNALIFAILYNALRDVPLPQGQPHTQFNPTGSKYLASLKRQREASENDDYEDEYDHFDNEDVEQLKKIRLKNTLNGLFQDEKKLILSCIKRDPRKSDVTPIVSSSAVEPFRKPTLPFAFPDQDMTRSFDDIPPRCRDINDLPNAEQLKERIMYVAARHNVKTVSNECIDLLSLGLEAHLKSILSNALQKVQFPHTTSRLSVMKSAEVDGVEEINVAEEDRDEMEIDTPKTTSTTRARQTRGKKATQDSAETSASPSKSSRSKTGATSDGTALSTPPPHPSPTVFGTPGTAATTQKHVHHPPSASPYSIFSIPHHSQAPASLEKNSQASQEVRAQPAKSRSVSPTKTRSASPQKRNTTQPDSKRQLHLHQLFFASLTQPYLFTNTSGTRRVTEKMLTELDADVENITLPVLGQLEKTIG